VPNLNQCCVVGWPGGIENDLADFQHICPSFQLDDELLAEEERDFMLGVKYQRCRNIVTEK
jgi:hypothetical protein